MGIPAPAGIAATGAPPAGDLANAVLSGVFVAIGTSLPFAFRGIMNVAMWGSLVTTLTTTSGSPTATVASATGLAIGAGIVSANVPRGTTIKNLAGTTVTLSANATVTGADAAASFTGSSVPFVGGMQLERSFDGGSTWIVCNLGGSGQLAQWFAGTPVSFTFSEPERQVLYRLNCYSWTSGTINYRISQTVDSLDLGSSS